MTTETAELRTAIQAVAHRARYVCAGDGDGADTRLDAAEFVSLLGRIKAEGTDVRRRFAKVKVEVSDGGEPLASLLRNSVTLRRFMDDERKLVHIVGNVWMSLSRGMRIEEACAKIIESVARHSLEEVVGALGSFLHTGTFPMRTLHFLKGAKVPEPIQLDASARLVPYAVAQKLSEAYAGATTSAEIPTNPDVGACALILDAAVRPGAATHPRDRASLDEVAGKGIGEEERPCLLYSGVAEFGHDFICVMLSLVSGKLFLPFSSYEIIPEVYSDSLPMLASTGSRVVTNVDFPIFPSRAELTFVDREELVQLVAAYSHAPEHVRRHLHVPLARLRSAKEKADDVDRAIDIQIAFEALLSRPTSHERQGRAAWLYAETPDEVEFVKRTIREFSAHRNSIVHGKPFTENPELVGQAESILVVCIKWIIRNQRIPCWASEMTSPMGNPRIDDPSSIRSRKHDTTSWTVAEACLIDEALSEYWQWRLEAGPPTEMPNTSGIENAGRSAKRNTLAQPNWSELLAAHPYRREAVEAGDKARMFHCEADIERHLRLWREALDERRYRVPEPDSR